MAFEVVKAMQTDGLEWGEGYRPLGRQALEEIIEDQMAAAVDRYLDQLQADDAADRRNGYYRRHLLTELGDIELEVPRTRRYSPTEVVRAYARRTREVDRVILAGFVLGLSTRKVGETLLALLGRSVSPSTVSQVAKTLDAAVAAFHRRPLTSRPVRESLSDFSPDRAAALTAGAAAWFAGGTFALATVSTLVAASRLWTHPFTSSPGSLDGLTALLEGMANFLISAGLLVSVVAVVVRFAKSSGEERLQLKWCAAAALVLSLVFVASIWVNSAVVNVPQSVAFLCLWTAIATAVLKYRLYEIDRIISRTLAYAIVTGLLVGLYAGLVLLATHVLSFSSPVAVAARHAGRRGTVQPGAEPGAARGRPAVQPSPL